MSDKVLRTYTFIDGQNLFRSVKRCFNYYHPNYDPLILSQKIASSLTCEEHPNTKCEITKVCFYTGVPQKKDNPFWNHIWSTKIRKLKNQGVHTFTKKIYYSGGEGREKGIDVRMALDIVRGYRKGNYDVAIIFSQDTDLEEAIEEVYDMRNEFNNRWVQLFCAFPYISNLCWGLNNTKWIKINKKLYDKCIDPRDYRPKRK